MQNEFSRLIDLTKLSSIDTLLTFKADEKECADVAKRFDLVSVSSLSGSCTIIHDTQEECYRINGDIKAKCEQRCIVTLKPVAETIQESFSVWLRPSSRQEEDESNEELDPYDDIDYYVGDSIDMGEIITQYLSVFLDPYPKAESAKLHKEIMVDDNDDIKVNPFKDLEKLKS